MKSILDGAEPDGGVVLVLDDAHLTPPAALRELVDVVTSQMPAGAMLAVSSRSEPPLPLGRLRARRALVEVRVQDLEMRPADASTLLRHAGLELDFTTVQALVRRTEGWPAGLYLGALSIGEQDDVNGAVSRLRGDDHRLAEYFRDEILSVLPPDLTEFAVLHLRARGAVGAAVRRRPRSSGFRAAAPAVGGGQPAAPPARPGPRAVSLARSVPRHVGCRAAPDRSRARARCSTTGRARGTRATETPTMRSPMRSTRTISCEPAICCGAASSAT